MIKQFHRVSSDKVNDTKSESIQKLKYLIYFEAFAGINRTYLLGHRKIFSYVISVYNLLLILMIALYINLSGLYNPTALIYKNTQIINYLLLSFCSLFLQKSRLERFFQSLHNVDSYLRITEDSSVITPINHYTLLLIFVTIYNFFDFLLSYIYLRHPSYNWQSFFCSLLIVIANDVDIIFCCILLIMVLNRLILIHTHVAKEYSQVRNFNKFTMLAKRVNLNISNLHKIYDSLHSLSMEVGKIISSPVMFSFMTCGLTAIMMMCNIMNPALVGELPLKSQHYVGFYGFTKCFKNAIIVLLPCYYGSLTIRRARMIRMILQKAITTSNADFTKRCQLKAFYQLSRDNEFIYTLWGFIQLNMALPLKFYYMCLTYFFIVKQFSKFFD